jgi:hypothetical protein
MPYAKLLLVAALVVLACFALVMLLKSRRREGPMLERGGRGLPPMKGSLDADKRGRGVSVELGREILEMSETGRRAEAVALVRSRTGWGAAEAEAMLVKLDNLRKRLES